VTGGRRDPRSPGREDSAPDPGTALRARRLLRWYPAEWRDRYGEEFTALLTDDLAERPRAWRRDADVAWSGLTARLAVTGLTHSPLRPAAGTQRALAALGCAMAVFLTVGAALWAQLTVGWQWSARPSPLVSIAMVTMSGAAALLAGLAVMAAAPLGWRALAQVAGGRGGGLVRPSLLSLAGASALIVGARHFENGWPGTGGHPWPYQGLVPGGVGAFLWAATLSVSAYWAHPAALASFGIGEIAWMALSPAAITCLVAGAAVVIRRLDLGPALLRYEGRLARVMAASLMVFLAGAGLWVCSGPRGLFHAGAVDVAGLALMTAAFGVSWRAADQARRRDLAA